MARKQKPVLKCIRCQCVISGPLYAIQFSTKEGWCTENCFNLWVGEEETRLEQKLALNKNKDGPVYNPRAQ